MWVIQSVHGSAYYYYLTKELPAKEDGSGIKRTYVHQRINLHVHLAIRYCHIQFIQRINFHSMLQVYSSGRSLMRCHFFDMDTYVAENMEYMLWNWSLQNKTLKVEEEE